ncbi:phage prohead protease, HK97 family [Thermaerobacter marianensis DSM 12885]|uniref:Phage prohead protease, HK97 family n=1 Tax=Thermaerobacter marianensis (strain ATCC 700841 / DSM 12885 / JCM 10246 / 7p75a) TaxID=644966 RepID=E6SKH6_THEM7|nr:HK97 family phage prohead protease [Thermaerobacter marianensis]ADU50163.1 phage prohead protease, HK97 family [Thermaerobacter marianensis DSM 12885]
MPTRGYPTEFKTVSFSLTRFDESAGTVEGYASTWDRDEDGDVIVKGAFKKTIQERVPAGKVKLLDSHRWDSQHVLGTVVEAREEDHGLWIKAIFSGSAEAQAVRQKVLEGHLTAFSIGFESLRDEIKADEQGRPTRYIYEVKLYEVSIVPFPANENAVIMAAKQANGSGRAGMDKPIEPLFPPGTRVRLLVPPHIEGQPTEAIVREAVVGVAYGLLFEGDSTIHRWYVESELAPADGGQAEGHSAGHKYKGVVPFQDLPLADRDRPWDADAAVQRVRRWASRDGSGEKDTIDWARYRRAFVWYDSSNAEHFGSYKLPVADVIDGQLRAVPRAIFAAAAAVQGARGGVDIPASDLPAVRNHLARYYRKMGETPPWEQDSLDLIVAEVKAGRRNSQADFERIAGAISLLWEALNDDEKAQVMERLGLAPAAGPDETPPTDGGEVKGEATEPPTEDASALMAALEVLDAELDLLETEVA